MPARKILIVTNRVPYPLKDGGNLAMHVMIRGYHEAGWQVYLFAMNTIRHKVSHDRLHELYKDIHAFEWMDIDNSVRGITVLKNFLFSKLPEHAERFYKPEFEQRLSKIVADFRPDVVQMESVYLSGYLPVIKKMAPDALNVLRLHNLEYQIWHSLAGKKKGLLRKTYLTNLSERLRNYERAAWKQFDLLLPITEKDANQVKMLEDADQMLVAPFSIDVDQIPVTHVQERWVGYHLGAMDWLANQDAIKWFLQEVWPKLHKAVPSFEFYFAGRNMPDSFKTMRREGVFCKSEVPDAHEFIADKKILIVPLRSGGGIRVKILEAMAAGKVIIATGMAIKGIDARAGEHFMLVRKPADFVAATKWVLENKQAAEQMAERARALILEKYDMRIVAGRIIHKLEEMLAHHEMHTAS